MMEFLEQGSSSTMILLVAVATGLWLLSAVVMAGQADSPGPDDPVVF